MVDAETNQSPVNCLLIAYFQGDKGSAGRFFAADVAHVLFIFQLVLFINSSANICLPYRQGIEPLRKCRGHNKRVKG